jgi:hypothetical protein
MNKKNISQEERRKSKKMVERKPQDDDSPRLATEDPNSSGLQENLAGGQVLLWTVQP